MAGIRIRVVIPAYKAASWISDCLDSLRRQTHPGWFAVVVDDGSNDDTVAAVGPFLSDRLRLMQRQTNAGVSVARNAGLAALPGTDAVLFLDADDTLAPDALARLSRALQAHPNAVAASGSAAFLRKDGSIHRMLTPPSGDILASLVIRNRFANGGHLLIRTHALARAGGFLPSLTFGEDWEYWIRLTLQGPFVTASDPAPVLDVRRSNSGAYGRLARDPEAFRRCLDTIFTSPHVAARLGRALPRLRRRAETEARWARGRALIGAEPHLARPLLRAAVAAYPSPRRLLLLAAAHCPPAWKALTA